MTDPKTTLRHAFEGLARGDARAFVQAMADDFTWHAPGHHAWAGTWRGRQAVREQLFAPLFQRFEGAYTNQALRFIAEGDTVVVECRGHARTTGGQDYDNTYCFVCRFDDDGRMVELTEYMDSAHAEAVLGPPPWHAGGSATRGVV